VECVGVDLSSRCGALRCQACFLVFRRLLALPLSKMAFPGPIKLTYFGIEGVAEKVRLALVLGGVDFEDDRVDFKDWPALKATTKYGQLPQMKIGEGEPFAQSGAMLRYVGQVAGLYPTDKILKVEEVIGIEEDLGRAVMPSLYVGMRPHIYGYPEEMPQEERAEIQKKLREKLVAADGDIPRMLGYLENFLGDSQFMCGDEPTIADCQVIPRLRHLTKGVLDGVPTTILDGFPKLKAYSARFHELPKIKAYHEKLAAAAK